MRHYAVAAVTVLGGEGFLSDQVTNDDRDHDGATDAEEAAAGVTHPSVGRSSLVVRPHPNHLDGPLSLQDLIDEPVLDVDTT